MDIEVDIPKYGITIKLHRYYYFTSKFKIFNKDIHFVGLVIGVAKDQNSLYVNLEAIDTDIDLDKYIGFYKFMGDYGEGVERYRFMLNYLDGIRLLGEEEFPLLINWYQMTKSFKYQMFGG
jgi:hypothetical protein